MAPKLRPQRAKLASKTYSRQGREAHIIGILIGRFGEKNGFLVLLSVISLILNCLLVFRLGSIPRAIMEYRGG